MPTAKANDKATEKTERAKTKIDFTKKPKRVKDKRARVAQWIQDAKEDAVTGEVEITAYTPRRAAMGLPPMEILNPDLEAALDDIATLTGVA